MEEMEMRHKIIKELIQHLSDSDGDVLKSHMSPPDEAMPGMEPEKEVGVGIMSVSDDNGMKLGEGMDDKSQEMDKDDIEKLVQLYSSMK